MARLCPAPSASYALFTTLHFLTFVLALTICGLYGQDLDAARRKPGTYPDSKWVFAVVVGGLSALFSLLLAVPVLLRWLHPWASIVLFVLNMALFGVFGAMFIQEDPEGDGGIQRMKNAVWVVLASALLWLIDVGAGIGYWFKHRERRTRFTGRAKV